MELAAWLLYKGCDPTDKTDDGTTVSDYARRSTKRDALLKLFEEHQAAQAAT